MKMQRKFTQICGTIILALCISPAALAGHSHFPNSEWTLNLAKSNLGQGPSVKSDVVTLTQDTDDWISYSEVAIGADGKTSKLSWAGPQNGELRPMGGMLGAMASFTTEDDSGHFIYPDGTSAHNWFWASSDGRTLTYHVVGMKKDHSEFQQTLVYDRTK
jgi:hypothetical protein